VIDNYNDLLDAVPRWAANTKVVEVAAECIQLAEARIRNDLLIRRVERAAHGTFDGAVIFLPADCEAVQRLMYYVGEQEYSVPYSDPKSVEHLTSSVGDPVRYSMADQTLVLYPTPSIAREYSLYYIPYVADLSDTNQQNWLIDRSPNVYLTAACLEAALYLQDTNMAGMWEGRYKQALDSLYLASERQRMPSNTPLVARPFRAVKGL
jgi:hypothetical protein